MTRVAWLADAGNQDGTIGGAELTQAEFKAAAPKGVEVVDVPPDEIERVVGCDVACVFNSVFYPNATIRALTGKKVVRYWNDVAPHGDPELKAWLCAKAINVFCSPLHEQRFPHEHNGHELIPPPVDLAPFREAAESAGERAGAVAVGPWQNFGKAPHLAAEWAAGNGGIDFYGGGVCAPVASRPVAYGDMPKVLASYKTFVHLPTALEPFGRTVVEAWAAGCEIVVNRLVGARWWIEERPEKLETAASDFWKLLE